ncbi:MAG: hypothetical protein ISF22_03030 [Methanomassiliicoccus sp.]|nr:hypothetical protein [Methanomassiliicoccus sp.]
MPEGSFIEDMSSCRCTAIKHATAGLDHLDRPALDEIGLGEHKDIDAFNRFIDEFRTLFYLRRGLPVSGFSDQREMYERYLAGRPPYEEFAALSTVEAALLLFRSRRGRGRCSPDDPRQFFID